MLTKNKYLTDLAIIIMCMTGIISFFFDCMYCITKWVKQGSSVSLVNKWKLSHLKKLLFRVWTATGRYTMSNNQTLRPASGLNRNPRTTYKVFNGREFRGFYSTLINCITEICSRKSNDEFWFNRCFRQTNLWNYKKSPQHCVSPGLRFFRNRASLLVFSRL